MCFLEPPQGAMLDVMKLFGFNRSILGTERHYNEVNLGAMEMTE